MNTHVKKLIGIVLALSLVIGLGFYASDAKLKATDEEVLPEVEVAPAPDPEPAPAEPAPVEPAPAEPSQPEEVVLEENEDYVLSEVVPGEGEAPAEEPAEPAEETPAEVTVEETPAEEAPAEEAFNVAEAYAYYITLGDAEKEAYLNSLSAEDRAALVRYIEQMEKAAQPAEESQPEAEEPKTEEKPEIDTSKMSLRVWDNRSSQMGLGQTVTLYSELQGFDGIDFSYRWQCNKGSGWQDVPGGNGATYSFEATVESLSWSWRLLIDY